MRRAALVVLSLLLLAGCSGDPTPAPSIPVGPPPSTTAEQNASFGDQTLSPRGNRVKAIGQPGAVLGPDGATPVLEFRIDAIRQGAECEADGINEAPENGQFVAVDVYGQTSPEFDPANSDTELLSSGYAIVTADGRRHQTDTFAAYACSSTQENLTGLTPGITVSGTVYLDAPADLIGAVVTLTSVFVDGGWEWQVPSA